MEINFQVLAAELLAQADALVPQWLPAGKKRGNEWTVGDLAGSAGESCKINLTTGQWADFAGDQGGGDLISLYAAIHGLKQLQAAQALSPEPVLKTNGTGGKHIEATYPYVSAEGELLYEVVRYHPKDFRQRRPNQDGGFTWNLKGITRVLYRLPQTLQAIQEQPKRVIWIPEGEKDVDRLTDLGCVATTNAGGAGKGSWRKNPQYADALRGANVVILPDNDEAGRIQAGEIAHCLSGVAARIRVLMLPGLPEKGDVSDWLAAGGAKDQLPALLKDCNDYVQEIVEPESAPPKEVRRGTPRGEPNARTLESTGVSSFVSWQELGLQLNHSEMPFENVDNVVRILANHPQTQGKIWYDTFRSRVMTQLASDTLREWADHDDLQLLLWLQRDMRLSKLSLETARNGLNAHATSHKRDELTEWLTSLTWDRVERIPKFMADAYGCVQDEYHEAVGRCWLVSMVARALNPGCQVDTMTVLCGPQGLKKSSSLEVLVGREWHAAISQEFGNRDWLQSIEGKWLIEVPDLSGFIGRDLEHIKAIITTREDRYCKRYSRRAETVKRRSVLVATTNSDAFLGDPTGARRFLPVTVTDINIDYIEDSRIQLFAEAVALYRIRPCWWDFPQDIASAQQEARRTIHPFEVTIEAWLMELGNIQLADDQITRFVASATVLGTALGIEPGRQSGPDSSRVTSIMARLGFKRGRVTYGRKQIRAFIQDISYKNASIPVLPDSGKFMF